MAATVTVIVLSYNRPKMLGEALQSIKGADEILVVDDGSDFDVEKVIEANRPDCPSIKWWVKPKLTVEQRLVTARVGKNMNEAIHRASSDVITYLCDDDLFAPRWISAVKEHFSKPGFSHWVRGWWGSFKDWDNPLRLEDPYHHLRCNIAKMPGHGLTTGSFAHLKICATLCGVIWSEDSVAVHDAFLVGRYLQIHPDSDVPLLVEGAGWRREHSLNMMKFTTMKDEYTPAGKTVLGKSLE